MAHWLLRGNPDRWRVHDFFRDHSADELTNWSVTRYPNDVSEGDDIALWLAGRDGGVIALGVVTGPIEEALGSEDPGEDSYWADANDAAAVRWVVPLRLLEVFVDNPISREEFRHDPRLSRAMILRQPFAGNPFPLSDDEWAAILDRHQQSGARACRSRLCVRPGGRYVREIKFIELSSMPVTEAVARTGSAHHA